jgi:hypothetical protein
MKPEPEPDPDTLLLISAYLLLWAFAALVALTLF